MAATVAAAVPATTADGSGGRAGEGAGGELLARNRGRLAVAMKGEGEPGQPPGLKTGADEGAEPRG